MAEPGPLVIGYDLVAERYADEVGDELAHKPIDRALYAAFAALVGVGGRVGDVGCGPGHITRHLADIGLDPVGVDPSSGMIAIAERRHPSVDFRLGSYADLGEQDGCWAGAVAPYSLIHVSPSERPAAYAELARVIAPGGWLLVAFHVSMPDQPTGSVRHMKEWWGVPVTIDFHFIEPGTVVAGLDAAGFATMVRTEREPWPELEAPSRRCYLLAQRRSPPSPAEPSRDSAIARSCRCSSSSLPLGREPC